MHEQTHSYTCMHNNHFSIKVSATIALMMSRLQSIYVSPLQRLIVACYLLVGWLSSQVSCLSLSVVLPLKNKYSIDTDALLLRGFNDMVDSDEFFKRGNSEGHTATCGVPVFGDKVQVSLRRQVLVTDADSSKPSQSPDEYTLVVDEAKSKEDVGWIYVKLYECREIFGDAMDFSELRSLVAAHFNSLPPNPGYDAASAPWAGSAQTKKLFAHASILDDLEEKGYVVIESGPKTSVSQNEKLTKFLVEKTNQRDAVRRDTVHFLNQGEAYSCGLEEHYELLMSIASHLNDHLHFRESPHNAVRPATNAKPLTVPSSMQIAEYGENDFYKAHSDNSLAEGTDIRSNFRHFTCILYCNDDWTIPGMGGALRLYPGSRHHRTPEDSLVMCDHVDINPLNGRLLIFDSSLTHSVQKVAQSEHTRRALTLWINRPDDSGVKGETFY